MNRVMAQADDFDVIHFHTDFLHFPFFNLDRPARTVTTLHGRLDLPELPLVFGEFPHTAVVSISDDQRRPLPWLNWRSTVYHGLPVENFTIGAGSGGYLAFLGRICPDKRPDRAIDIARRVGLPLKIAAKVDKADTVYFEEVIRPLLRDPLIEYVGEIGEAEKSRFLDDASALLFPIDWPEPFGLTMIEAMGCGTPVIAYHHGSVPEIVEDGVTGFVVGGEQEAADRMDAALSLDRDKVRARFEQRFSVERMMRDYLNVYMALAEKTSLVMHPLAIASPSKARPPAIAA
jgi:glycosyltransferase involved in cell wall biosynthesis